MKRTRLALAFLVLLTLPLGNCGSGGDECSTCSSDDDCQSGLVCSKFSDGSQRCASGLGETTCKTR